MGIEIKAKRALKISEDIRKPLYNCIIHNPQVVQSPIAHDCLKVKIYGNTEPILVQKTYYGCLSENLIIILLVPQKMANLNK